jgi:hypothetical protein
VIREISVSSNVCVLFVGVGSGIQLSHTVVYSVHTKYRTQYLMFLLYLVRFASNTFSFRPEFGLKHDDLSLELLYSHFKGELVRRLGFVGEVGEV